MPKRPASDSWQDPHATREADRYENPIPSREFILDVLEKSDAPLTTQQVAAHFQLFDEEREEALRRRLGAMVRDGQIEANRRGAYSPLAESALIKGRVTGHPDGFGFLIPEDGSADLLLTSREMRRVFHGDIVLAREAGYDHKGRREAQVVRVVEKRMKAVVGRYQDDAGSAFVVSDNPRITQEVMIIGQDFMPSVGQFVTVEIVDYPTARSAATGRITEILGDYLAPGMEIDIAIRNFEIPHVWPIEVEQEAARFDPQVQEADKLNRMDLRDLPLVTIDGEDARDFDDAVFCEKRRGGGFRLIVAIADVSHYVRTGSALNEEALKRGNSVYFPQQVVPMLPEALSNGLCSLNPHVDRLCMLCDMNISAAGKVTAYKFAEGVMHSQARLTYTKVSDLLEHPESDAGKKVAHDYAHVVRPVQQLYELFKVLRVVREKRGALDFDSNETRIIFGADRKIEKIVPVSRNKAHMLIEECMLAANVCAADFAAKNKLPALYRNHEGPRDEKLSKLRNYLGALGIAFTAGKKPQPSDFQAVLEKIQDRPDAHVIQTMLLRSLTQAVYAPENLGHFGLAYEAYGHFTSPIRRYPDLLLHRVIRAKLRGERTMMQVIGAKINEMRGQPAAKKAAHDAPDMVQMLALGEHCSMTERRADEATRDVMAWLKCEYMREHVGDEFDGVIAGVTSFGIFVELTDIYVEGLVHISNLKGDYYEFDATMQKLIGTKSGVQFALGDTLRIKVAAVNLESRKMDFDLVSGGGTQRRSSAGKSGDKFSEKSSGKSFGKASDKSGGKSGEKSHAQSVRDRLRTGDIPSGGGKNSAGKKTSAGRDAPAKSSGNASAKPSAKKSKPAAKKPR